MIETLTTKAPQLSVFYLSRDKGKLHPLATNYSMVLLILKNFIILLPLLAFFKTIFGADRTRVYVLVSMYASNCTP